MNYFYYCYWFPSKTTTRNVYLPIKIHHLHIYSTGTQQGLNKCLFDELTPWIVLEMCVVPDSTYNA